MLRAALIHITTLTPYLTPTPKLPKEFDNTKRVPRPDDLYRIEKEKFLKEKAAELARLAPPPWYKLW